MSDTTSIWTKVANRCPEPVPWRDGSTITTECGLRKGHEGPCERRDECSRCGATDDDLRRPGSSEADMRWLGFGPDEDLCLTCWGKVVEALPHPVACSECGAAIDPYDVGDLDVDYVCVECDSAPSATTRDGGALG